MSTRPKLHTARLGANTAIAQPRAPRFAGWHRPVRSPQFRQALLMAAVLTSGCRPTPPSKRQPLHENRRISLEGAEQPQRVTRTEAEPPPHFDRATVERRRAALHDAPCSRSRAAEELELDAKLNGSAAVPTADLIEASLDQCVQERIAGCQRVLNQDLDAGVSCWNRWTWNETPRSMAPDELSQATQCIEQVRTTKNAIEACLIEPGQLTTRGDELPLVSDKRSTTLITDRGAIQIQLSRYKSELEKCVSDAAFGSDISGMVRLSLYLHEQESDRRLSLEAPHYLMQRGLLVCVQGVIARIRSFSTKNAISVAMPLQITPGECEALSNGLTTCQAQLSLSRSKCLVPHVALKPRCKQLDVVSAWHSFTSEAQIAEAIGQVAKVPRLQCALTLHTLERALWIGNIGAMSQPDGGWGSIETTLTSAKTVCTTDEEMRAVAKGRKTFEKLKRCRSPIIAGAVIAVQQGVDVRHLAGCSYRVTAAVVATRGDLTTVATGSIIAVLRTREPLRQGAYLGERRATIERVRGGVVIFRLLP